MNLGTRSTPRRALIKPESSSTSGRSAIVLRRGVVLDIVVKSLRGLRISVKFIAEKSALIWYEV
jgi:hypothetical protein